MSTHALTQTLLILTPLFMPIIKQYKAHSSVRRNPIILGTRNQVIRNNPQINNWKWTTLVLDNAVHKAWAEGHLWLEGPLVNGQ